MGNTYNIIYNKVYHTSVRPHPSLLQYLSGFQSINDLIIAAKVAKNLVISKES